MAKSKKKPAKAAKNLSKNNGPIHPLLDGKNVAAHQDRLRALSAAVNDVMAAHGFLGDGEKVVCEDVIVILPDGTPRVERRCYSAQS